MISMKILASMLPGSLRAGLVLLGVCAATNQVPGPVFKEDPRFPLRAVFMGIDHPNFNGARDDAKVFVAWGGPNREWLTSWDLQTGELKSQRQVLRMADRLQVPQLSPSGKYYFQPSVDKSGTKTITYLDSQTGQPGKTATFNLTSPPVAKVNGSSQDERSLLIEHGGGPTLSGGRFQPAPPKGLPQFRGLLLVANDFRYAVASDEKLSRLYLVDIDKGKLALDMPLPPLGEYADQPLRSDLSDDGKTLLLRTAGHALSVIDVSGKKVSKSLSGHGDEITSFRLAHDGARAFSIAKDNTLRFWDAKAGTELAKHPMSWSSRLGLSQELVWTQASGAVRSFTSAGAPVGRLRTIPSSRAILSASGDYMADVVQDGRDAVFTLWKMDPPTLIGEHSLDVAPEAVWISPDGHFAMTRRGADHWVIDVRENKEVWAGKTSGGQALGLLPEAKGFVQVNGAVIQAVPFGPGAPLWKHDFGSRRRTPQAFRFCGGGRLLSIVLDIPVVIDLATGAATLGSRFPTPIPGLTDAFVSDDAKTVVTLQPERREVSWWNAEGDLTKTCTIEPGTPFGGGENFSISPEASRAYVALRDRLLIVTPDGTVSNYSPFAQNYWSPIRLFGESVLLQNGDSALLLKSSPVKGR
jgi:hypothetical protein